MHPESETPNTNSGTGNPEPEGRHSIPEGPGSDSDLTAPSGEFATPAPSGESDSAGQRCESNILNSGFKIPEERNEKIFEFLQRLGLEPDLSELHLFEAALTHSSYAFEKQLSYDNERMEFLGDAVIGLLTAEDVFHQFKDASEGELSKRRGRIVSRNNLGRLAREMGIAEVVLLGKGEERSGGRQRPVLLGSVLEALVGAVYLSLGWEITSTFVRRNILQPLEHTPIIDIASDYKSVLQEYVQKHHRAVPVYRIARQIGPDHDKRFLVEVSVRGQKWGQGWGSRKQRAENEAARSALENVGHKPWDRQSDYEEPQD